MSILRIGVGLGMLFDFLLFPSVRRAKIVAPIVIVGNPRSGTTFLHRFLADNRIGAGMTVWRMMLPSLAFERLMRPLKPLINRFSPVRHHKEGPHPTSFDSVETEDGALFLRFFDGLLYYCYFLAWDERDWLDRFDPKVHESTARDARWLEAIWKRNLVATGCSRVVAKFFSTGANLPGFLARFPDARIIYCMRDPVDTIPSTLSLVTGVLDRRFGFWKLPQAVRDRYIIRIYEALLALSRRTIDDMKAGRADAGRVFCVPYARLMTDFEGLMKEIVVFTGTPLTAELAAGISRVAESQKTFKSGHRYDSVRYGLTAERIRNDHSFFYEWQSQCCRTGQGNPGGAR